MGSSWPACAGLQVYRARFISAPRAASELYGTAEGSATGPQRRCKSLVFVRGDLERVSVWIGKVQGPGDIVVSHVHWSGQHSIQMLPPGKKGVRADCQCDGRPAGLGGALEEGEV